MLKNLQIDLVEFRLEAQVRIGLVPFLLFRMQNQTVRFVTVLSLLSKKALL